MENFLRPNKTLSFVIVILFLGLIVYAGFLSFNRDGVGSQVVSDDAKSKSQGQWIKAEFLSTPEGLPGFSFNYSSSMSIEDNGANLDDVDDILGEVSMVRIYSAEDQERVLSGEVDVASTSADIINICEISANCFPNLPDMIGSFDTMGEIPLEEIGKVTYGTNVYTVYKDSSFGDLPLTIYTLRFGENKIFGIHHLGKDNPPTTIDLASVQLIFAQ